MKVDEAENGERWTMTAKLSTESGKRGLSYVLNGFVNYLDANETQSEKVFNHGLHGWRG